MSAIAFLFPGQGSQYVGMGKDLAARYPVARRTFEEADAALGIKLSQLCFEGPEEQLKLTEITQPAILTVSVAALRVLREKGVTPAFAAGHSLGEYSAHVAAGTLSFEDALHTGRVRGRYMQEAVPVGQGAMAAILGMPIQKLTEICHDAARGEVCAPANINSPEQIVISGNTAAVERATELAKQRGAKRAILLQVSAPFHCSLLKPAQEKLAQHLAQVKFQPMSIPVVTNVDAQLVKTPEAARDSLVRQVTGAVRWVECTRKLIEQGVETFLEVGPGKVLCGLMRQIDRSKRCANVEDEGSLQKALE
jgi:[acyl-carrier-protein] S-malonyltransferase